MRGLLTAIPTYSVIGAVCLAINNVILIGGERLGVHYLPATLFCYVFVGGFAFVCHAKLTFRTMPSWRGYLRFQAAQATGAVLTLAMLFALRGLLDLPMWVAAPAATLAMFVYNFVSTRWAVSAPSQPGQDAARPRKIFSR